ncbi:MAG: beta/gamma crystallin family protein [Pseudomonadota bacterium]|nr:beta/gamma crystallin family protein [Pseudomonadota bacterium]
MQNPSRLFIGLALAGAAMAASAQVTFFEHDGFRGRSFTSDRPVENFARFGFNDRASSVIVRSGRWELCEDARFGGRCVVLRPGRYGSLRAIGMNDRVSSVRRAGGPRRSYPR